MKVYISGPMTGIEDYNRPAFNAAATKLRRNGIDVFNPAEIQLAGEATWSDYMRVDIRWLTRCDAVVVLDGWMDSRGARLEVNIAHELGIPVGTLELWEEKTK